MATARQLIADQEFVSKEDHDEVKTTWVIRSMSAFEWVTATNSGKVDWNYMVSTCLTGWTNFRDESGSNIEFSANSMGMIPPLIFQDIATEIMRISSMTEDERKN